MYTPTSRESLDLFRTARLGELMKNFLSANDYKMIVDDLWSIYTGYMVFEEQTGFNPRCSEVFLTFKDLVFLFEKAGNLKA